MNVQSKANDAIVGLIKRGGNRMKRKLKWFQNGCNEWKLTAELYRYSDHDTTLARLRKLESPTSSEQMDEDYMDENRTDDASDYVAVTINKDDFTSPSFFLDGQCREIDTNAERIRGCKTLRYAQIEVEGMLLSMVESLRDDIDDIYELFC